VFFFLFLSLFPYAIHSGRFETRYLFSLLLSPSISLCMYPFYFRCVCLPFLYPIIFELKEGSFGLSLSVSLSPTFSLCGCTYYPPLSLHVFLYTFPILCLIFSALFSCVCLSQSLYLILLLFLSPCIQLSHAKSLIIFSFLSLSFYLPHTFSITFVSFSNSVSPFPCIYLIFLCYSLFLPFFSVLGLLSLFLCLSHFFFLFLVLLTLSVCVSVCCFRFFCLSLSVCLAYAFCLNITTSVQFHSQNQNKQKLFCQ